MRVFFISVGLFLVLFAGLTAQSSSFIVLGDLHYDLIGDHDMEWLNEKPDDLRQVMEYTVFTDMYWDDLMKTIQYKTQETSPGVKAILQLGDLSEGLAGNELKAEQMASNTIRALRDAEMPVPWILTKGNHDITGPGAKEAFDGNYLPFIRNQTGDPNIRDANYSYRFGNVEIFCVDIYNRDSDPVYDLKRSLARSDAKYKFVAVHEPVIPVTERCWHLYRRSPEKRDALLETIARHKAIVLCGHLHRYSVVSRNTPYGNIIQVMSISVVRDSAMKTPSYEITEYGPSLVANQSSWQPATIEKRKAMLAEEAGFVEYYKQTDLAGYAVIKVDDQEETVIMEYYAAFADQPYDIVNLTELF